MAARKLELEALEERILLSVVGMGRNLITAGDTAETAEGELLAEVQTGQALLEITDLLTLAVIC